MSTEVERARGLERDGIKTERARWNLTAPALYEEAVRRGEGLIAADGPLACRTGQHTGRSPNDKFIVREPSSSAEIAWGKINRPLETAQFDALHQDMLASLNGKDLFVLDCFAGADPAYRLPVRIVNELAWHNLFCRNLFIDDPAAAKAASPEFTIIDVPSFKADPARHGSNSDVMIALNFARKLVLITGSSYAGEMKGVLAMHCSANIGPAGDAALFFGLSGTGKTTLSSDPDRTLIGDDEHGWSDRGVFNFEGGCYAKTIRLSAEAEPQIYATTRRFGTVLENVVVDEQTRALNLDDDRFTENTRAAYPISFIENAVASGQGGHPQNVVMLTADAFGVLPPISRLTPDAAMYHFLSGYTAKVAGTEKGVTQPKATFSTCFGAPFLPLAPSRYARMLGEKIARQHRVDRRSVRRRRAHEDLLHTGDDSRGPRRRPRQCHVRERFGVQPGRPDQLSRSARRDPETATHVGQRRGVRRAGGDAGAHVRGEFQGVRAGRHRRSARRWTQYMKIGELENW
jgi:phosphoenolpyruvate carboxykinase (ATP)